MSNEIAIITEDKVQLLKDQICKGATDSELQLFISTCNRTKLDPLSRQCWAVKRWDKNLGREVMSFQTGVDGFRVIANRSDKYAGQIGPYWCGDDGLWKDVWLENKPPVASKVAVLRSDFKEPLWAVAKFSSYAARKKDGSLSPFWVKMPELMIAKVAECLALRKAFPQDLSGVYSQEEMEQSENPTKELETNNMEKEPLETKTITKSVLNKSDTTLIKTEAPSPNPIINHAPTNNTDLDNYKLRFSWGSFKAGLTFEQLGKKDTEGLLKGIQSWKLSKESKGETIPTLCEEFIDLAKQYLKRFE